MVTHSRPRRAVGIIRVSDVGGRSPDHFVSPLDQRARIVQACQANELELVTVHEELDVSAGLPIARRPGLGAALRALECHQADTIVVAYFDRLVRNLRVQAEIVERVEAAGGTILAVDVGRIRADTASHWLSSTMLGAVAEYHRRMTSERIEDSLVRAVESGVTPYALVLPGYRRGADGRPVVEPTEAQAVREAFRMRASGASMMEVRRYLASHGVERTDQATRRMLRSRFVLGELQFGDRKNVESHTPIVDVEVWQKVQRTFTTREAPGPKSERLLSGTRILKCANCGSTLTVATQTHRGKSYPMYKCHAGSRAGFHCERRVSISADFVEQFVADRVRELLADESATASRGAELDSAHAELESAQAKLAHAIEVLADLGDVEAAKAKLAQLRGGVDQATRRVAELERTAGPGLTINAAADWDRLTLAERRALIGAVIRRVVVAPGVRGSRGKLGDRLSVVTVADQE
jgi:site-specific DNA recombinase